MADVLIPPQSTEPIVLSFPVGVPDGTSGTIEVFVHGRENVIVKTIDTQAESGIVSGEWDGDYDESETGRNPRFLARCTVEHNGNRFQRVTPEPFGPPEAGAGAEAASQGADDDEEEGLDEAADGLTYDDSGDYVTGTESGDLDYTIPWAENFKVDEFERDGEVKVHKDLVKGIQAVRSAVNSGVSIEKVYNSSDQPDDLVGDSAEIKGTSRGLSTIRREAANVGEFQCVRQFSRSVYVSINPKDPKLEYDDAEEYVVGVVGGNMSYKFHDADGEPGNFKVKEYSNDGGSSVKVHVALVNEMQAVREMVGRGVSIEETHESGDGCLANSSAGLSALLEKGRERMAGESELANVEERDGKVWFEIATEPEIRAAYWERSGARVHQDIEIATGMEGLAVVAETKMMEGETLKLEIKKGDSVLLTNQIQADDAGKARLEWSPNASGRYAAKWSFDGQIEGMSVDPKETETVLFAVQGVEPDISVTGGEDTEPEGETCLLEKDGTPYDGTVTDGKVEVGGGQIPEGDYKLSFEGHVITKLDGTDQPEETEQVDLSLAAPPEAHTVEILIAKGQDPTPPKITEPIPEPKDQGVPFADETTGLYWPVRTNLSQGRLVSFKKASGGRHGGWGRCLLASRGDGERYHCGIDIYGAHHDKIIAIESGTIVNFYHFYRGTYCLFVQNDSGLVINYGEVESTSLRDRDLEVGDTIEAGQEIAEVGKMYHDSMLHFEMYTNGTTTNQRYYQSASSPPSRLLDPTKYLIHLAKNGR